MLRQATADDGVPTGMDPHMARCPTRAVGRASLARCRERRQAEQGDRSPPVLVALEAFETWRAPNQWCNAQPSTMDHRGHGRCVRPDKER